MGTLGKAWSVNDAMDTPEQIAMCLSCIRPKCVNCIGRPLDKAEKEREAYARRRANGWKRPYVRKKVKVYNVDGKVITPTAVEFLKFYPTVTTDRQIAKLINRAECTVYNIRTKLGLPAASTPVEEKTRLAKHFLDGVQREKDLKDGV